MKITILGCGTSAGTPSVGNNWGNCDSKNLKNYRTRSSIIVNKELVNILVDASPDLRIQSLNNKVSKLDAVIFTHEHADHCHGIDDLRFFKKNTNLQTLKAFSSEKVLNEIIKRFEYAFDLKNNQNSHYPPILSPVIINDTINFMNIKINCFTQIHGKNESIGYIFDDIFAYSTDVSSLTNSNLEMLKGIKLWIVDCLQIQPHLTHSHLEQTLNWIDIVKPKLSILTHMNSSLDYQYLKSILPDNVEPAYDSLVINTDNI
ncbi:MBL fold metallo-hydrolase [Alphaproteobacteria bacterium]|nr:MBL fold metallo-hydrolase [Alphaproteobacteria bacterium]